MKTIWLSLLVGILLLGSQTLAQAPTHSVTLTWTASTDAPANPTLTYNVYRATGSGCTTPLPTFSKINSAPITGVTFTDSTVSVGTLYAYQATAVLNALESVPSNCAQAAILPAAPTSLLIAAR